MANECAEVEFYTRTSLYTRNTRPSVDVGAANATPSQTNNFGQFAIHYQYDRGFRHMIVALSMSLVLIGPVLLAVLLQGEHFGMQTSMLRLNLTMLVVAVLASFLLLVAACSTGQDLIIAFDAQSGIRRYLRIGICCRGKFYRDRNFHQVSLQDVTNVYLHEWSYSATDSDGGWYTVNKIRVRDASIIFVLHTMPCVLWSRSLTCCACVHAFGLFDTCIGRSKCLCATVKCCIWIKIRVHHKLDM